MKSDTERKKHYSARLHKKRNDLHVHLSKELRKGMKKKTRSILVRRDDRVKILRGPGKGKEGKVSQVSTAERKVYVEGITMKNAKAKESIVPLQPSNLLLISLEPTEGRKKLFSEEAFKKAEKKAEKPKTETKPEAKPKEEKPKEAPKEEKKEKPPVPKAEAAPKAPEAPAPKR